MPPKPAAAPLTNMYQLTPTALWTASCSLSRTLRPKSMSRQQDSLPRARIQHGQLGAGITERKDRFLCSQPPPPFQASRMLPFFLESAGAGLEHPPPVFPRAPGAHRAQGLHCQQRGPLQTAVGVRNEAGTESLLSVDPELISFIVCRKHILNRGPHFRSSLGWSLPLLHSPYPRFAMLTSVVAEAYRIVAVVRHTWSWRTVASQKKGSMFCQLLLFVKFCQKQNRIKNNKQTSSLAA